MEKLHRDVFIGLSGETYEVSDLCQVDHGVDVVVTLHEGQAAFLS